MSKITSVEPQNKNPKRFNVFLDSTFAFGADEDLVVNYRLVPGKNIEQKDLEKLLFEAEVGKLMERMYGLFSIRARSEKEIRNYFRIKNYESRIKGKEQVSVMVIDLLIDRLKQKGLINDLEFAKAWVDARRKSKQKGTIALKSELYQKGISREIIDQVLSEESVDEGTLAEQALEKKLKSWKNLDKLTFKKKTYEFLARHGFNYQVISPIVAKILQKRYD